MTGRCEKHVVVQLARSLRACQKSKNKPDKNNELADSRRDHQTSTSSARNAERPLTGFTSPCATTVTNCSCNLFKMLACAGSDARFSHSYVSVLFDVPSSPACEYSSRARMRSQRG